MFTITGDVSLSPKVNFPFPSSIGKRVSIIEHKILVTVVEYVCFEGPEYRGGYISKVQMRYTSLLHVNLWSRNMIVINGGLILVC